MMAKAHSDVSRQEALNMAGSLLFSGDDVKKKISVLSGGEKSRVALGQILLQKAPCLILDEPTNHLDFQTVEALTEALKNYAGTVAVVSHDRSFIKRIGTKILEVNHGQVSLYPGTYEEYVWSLEKGVLSGRKNEAPQAKKQQNLVLALDPREEKKSLERDLRLCEKNIEKTEKAVSSLQARIQELNHKVTTLTGAELTVTIDELAHAQDSFTKTENEWFSHIESKEILVKKLKNLL